MGAISAGHYDVHQYVASSNDARHFDSAPKDVDGDELFPGGTVKPHSIPGEHFPDKITVFQGADEDVYVSKTSLYNERVPMMFRMSHGIDYRERAAELNKQIVAMGTVFARGSDKEVVQFIKKNAFTNKNIKSLKHIIRAPERILDPAHELDHGRLLRYMKGYKGELDTCPTRRRWKAVLYRPLIMARAALRTFRNPEEVGGKGFRTVPITLPAQLGVGALVACGSLGFISYFAHKDKRQAQSLQA